MGARAPVTSFKINSEPWNYFFFYILKQLSSYFSCSGEFMRISFALKAPENVLWTLFFFSTTSRFWAKSSFKKLWHTVDTKPAEEDDVTTKTLRRHQITLPHRFTSSWPPTPPSSVPDQNQHDARSRWNPPFFLSRRRGKNSSGALSLCSFWIIYSLYQTSSTGGPLMTSFSCR